MAVVDCHTHSYFSGDSSTSISAYVASFVRSGCTHVCITDHHNIDAFRPLQEELGDRVICGQEQRVVEGEIIGLFLREKIPPALNLFEASVSIREQGGLVYLCHPLDRHRVSVTESVMRAALEAKLIDAVEIYNSKSEAINFNVIDICQSYGVIMLAGSDSHVASSIGSSGVVGPWFDSAESFLTSMIQAKAFGQHDDPVRTWPTEVIPSTSSRNPTHSSC